MQTPLLFARNPYLMRYLIQAISCVHCPVVRRKHQNRLPDTNICIREVITREDYILVRLSGENSYFLVTFTPSNRHIKSESKMAASDGVYSNLPSPSRRFSVSLTCLPRLSWDYALSVRYIKRPPIPC